MSNSNTPIISPERLRLGVAIFGLVSMAWAGCAPQSADSPKGAAAATASVSAPPQTTAAPAAVPPVAPAPVKDPFKEAAAKTVEAFEGSGWEDMFSGESLAGWRVTPFSGKGEIELRSGLLVLNMGDPFTGVNFTNPFPKMDYEIALDAMRVMGSDFFCGLTVPVGESSCSLIVGGWGGGLVGVSSLDGMDASENETTKFRQFETGRWYRIRLRITSHRIAAWIDQEKVVDVDTTGRRISVRPGEIELSQPLGIASWQTAAAFREIKWRKVEPVGGGTR